MGLFSVRILLMVQISMLELLAGRISWGLTNSPSSCMAPESVLHFLEGSLTGPVLPVGLFALILVEFTAPYSFLSGMHSTLRKSFHHPLSQHPSMQSQQQTERSCISLLHPLLSAIYYITLDRVSDKWGGFWTFAEHLEKGNYRPLDAEEDADLGKKTIRLWLHPIMWTWMDTLGNYDACSNRLHSPDGARQVSFWPMGWSTFFI